MALRLAIVSAAVAVTRASSFHEDLAREEALEAEGASERRVLQAGTMYPLAGPDLPLNENGQPPLNEPCYTHGDMCSGCEQHTLALATSQRITFKHD